MKKRNSVLLALDMVHCDIRLKLEQMHETKVKATICTDVELACQLALVQAAMKDAGETREFKPYPGSRPGKEVLCELKLKSPR